MSNALHQLESNMGDIYYPMVKRTFRSFADLKEIHEIEVDPTHHTLSMKIKEAGEPDWYVVKLDADTPMFGEPVAIDEALMEEAKRVDPKLFDIISAFRNDGWALRYVPINLAEDTIEFRKRMSPSYQTLNDLRACVTYAAPQSYQPITIIKRGQSHTIQATEAFDPSPYTYNDVEAAPEASTYVHSNDQIVGVKVVKTGSLKSYPLKALPLQMLVDSWNFASTQITIADMLQRLRSCDEQTQDAILNDIGILATMNAVFLTGILSFKQTLEQRLSGLNVDKQTQKTLATRATAMMNVVGKMRGASACPAQPSFSVEKMEVQVIIGECQNTITLRQEGFEDVTCVFARKA